MAQPKDVSPQPGNDLHAQDLNDLASMLGGEERRSFTASAAASVHIDAFLNSFREFA